LNKILNIASPSTLWSHKKKIIFSVATFAYGANLLRLNNRDSKIRRFYAEKAKKFGEEFIKPTEKSRRITVLVNKGANSRKCSYFFTKNALPLFHLAGIEVDVINVDNEVIIDSLPNILDKPDYDALYIVGGDGTLANVITYICERNLLPSVPIGAFPGGRENRILRKLVPTIYEEIGDVRRYCESAMAVIEDTKRAVFPTKCEIASVSSNSEISTRILYLLSGMNIGWFEHCEQQKYKLWYWGLLKQKITYFWEFLKRSPLPLTMEISYQDFCKGCNNCKKK